MNSFNDSGHDPALAYDSLAPHLSDTALDELRRTHGSDTGRWLRTLVDSAIDPAAVSSEESHRIEENDLQLMIRWVGRLFDEFELYTLEFNRNTAGTDLIISTSAPNLENTSVENDNFEAHLSTRFWTMAFAATSDAVDVYMMPAELLLAFTTNRMDERYNPFIRFQANRQFNKYCWMIGDQAVSWEMLPQLAKELFGDLVNVASGHMNEKELFDLPPEEPMPLEPVIATVDTGAVFAQTEPTRPAPGPALYSSSLLSHDFLLSCQSFAVVLDAQLQALAASKTASVNDLSTTINCRQLTTDLTALKMQLLATMAKLKSASDGRAAA